MSDYDAEALGQWARKLAEAKDMKTQWEALAKECRTEILNILGEDFEGDAADATGVPVISVTRGTRKQLQTEEIKKNWAAVYAFCVEEIPTVTVNTLVSGDPE